MLLYLLLQDQLRQEVKSHHLLRHDLVLQGLESLVCRDEQSPRLLEEIPHCPALQVGVESLVPRTVGRHHLHHPPGHDDERSVYEVDHSVVKGDVPQENLGSDRPPVVPGVPHQSPALHPHPGLAGAEGRHHGELQPRLQAGAVLGGRPDLASLSSRPGEDSVARHHVTSHHGLVHQAGLQVLRVTVSVCRTSAFSSFLLPGRTSPLAGRK